MTHPHDSGTTGDMEPALAELADQVTRRLQANKPLDDKDELLQNARLAGSIRRLLPTLRTMVALGKLAALDRSFDQEQTSHDPAGDAAT